MKGVPAGPWSERVQEALHSLGVRSAELAQQHVLPAVDVFSDAPSNKRKYHEIAEGDEGPNKRARTEEDRASASSAMNTLTQLLPPPVIVSLVIDTFQRNLAPFMPTRSAQPSNPNALLVSHAISYLDSHLFVTAILQHFTTIAKSPTRTRDRDVEPPHQSAVIPRDTTPCHYWDTCH